MHAYEVASTCLADLAVPAPYFVVTPAPSLAPKTVHPARSPAITTAITVNARWHAASLANRVKSHASGNASITNAPNYATKLAIVCVVIARAENSYPAIISALVCAEKNAQRNVESVTKTRSRRFSSGLKKTKMHGSWNLPTVVICLK